MKRKTSLLIILAIIGLWAAPLGVAQSSGDSAAAQKDKQDAKTKKPARVFTNDDFPSGNSTPPQTSEKPGAPGSSSEVPTIYAETSNGFTVPLSPGAGTDIIFMATWCKHSKGLKEMLNDPQSKPYLANDKLVFVFSSNEWGEEKYDLEEMAKKGQIPESKIPAILEQMKKEAGSTKVMEPNFLSDLPGDYYFALPPKEVEGFPWVLTAHGYVGETPWLLNDRKIPAALYQKLVDQYDPQGGKSTAK
jgi:hypothetical protein